MAEKEVQCLDNCLPLVCITGLVNDELICHGMDSQQIHKMAAFLGVKK